MTRLCRKNQVVKANKMDKHNIPDNRKFIHQTRFATDARWAVTALPVASLTATSGTTAGTLPAVGGKVTPVRYEHGQQDGSGQEEDAEHLSTSSIAARAD